jgi:hypothetical protein
MPALRSYPRMTALIGDEVLLGSQSGTTETVTVQDIADYAKAQGTAGVTSVNGAQGDLKITAQSIGADPAGAAAASELAARKHSEALLSDHASVRNAHGLIKADLGLGNVADLAPADLPISSATQLELNALNNSLATKISDAPSDGQNYVRVNGVWGLAPAGGSNTQIKTEAQYAALIPEAGVVYIVLPNPPATNLIFNGDFASADSGWTQFAGTAATFTGGICAVNSTANHSIGQANAAMVAQPPAGGTLALSFRIHAYTEGTFNPRVRYTDGTFGYFYNNGDPTIAVGLAGGSATVGTHTAPNFTLDATKTFDRFEMRCAIRNTLFDASFDDIVLTVV